MAPLVTKILDANPHAYESLVVEGGTPTLAHELLDGVQSEQLLAEPNKPRVSASGMLVGLWLWHDGLEESHRISQSMSDSTGSFWHAIMHRREGDFSNSKYWYARTSGHPVFQTLAAHAGPIVNRAPADKMLLRLVTSGWNPNMFVDLVQEICDRPDDSRRPVAVALQRIEWKTLFDYCAR